jgi:hypothetical protein
MVYAPKRSLRQYKKLLAGELFHEYTELVVSHAERFHNFIMQRLFDMGRAVDHQYFARSLLVQTCGLSNAGRNLLSKMDVIISPTTHRRKVAAMLDERQHLLRYATKITNVVYVVVISNKQCLPY